MFRYHGVRRFLNNLSVQESYRKTQYVVGSVDRFQNSSQFKGNAKMSSSSDSSRKTIRIGCASGFWGDTAVSVPQLIHKGKLDYLVFDYLSEITMSLLTAVKSKFPDLGYAPDFVQFAMAPYLKAIKEKNIRVISNAGGINPLSCASALRNIAEKNGIKLNIAVVLGDNIIHEKESLKNTTKEMFSGIPFPDKVNSMSTYLGAGSIVKALDLGADIVITGRCTDSAVVLAPLIHEFKWSPDNFNVLAAGSLAGHIVECGAQATGGVYTDWQNVSNWDNIGFPIVECESNGEFILTKPDKTGGLVNKATAAEQLVYEIGDPRAYILPDVTCDFSQVKITPVENRDNAVKIVGAIGKPPPKEYKVSATYADSFRTTVVASIGGKRAVEKGRKTAEAIIKRTRNIFKLLKMEDFKKVHIQMLGAGESYGSSQKSRQDLNESVLWIAAQHDNKKGLEILGREVAAAGTGMAPGLLGLVGGRPKASPVFKLFSFLYPKEKIQAEIHLNGEKKTTYTAPVFNDSEDKALENEETVTDDTNLMVGENNYILEDLAYTRSGDKGNHANIGVIARHPSYVPYLRKYLTTEAVHDYFNHLFEDNKSPSDRVKRYELPGIDGFNFLLLDSLGGGGVASLRSDPQGKAFGQMLLDFEIKNMPDLNKINKS